MDTVDTALKYRDPFARQRDYTFGSLSLGKLRQLNFPTVKICTGRSPVQILAHCEARASLLQRCNDARAQANKYNAYGRAFPLTGE